MKRMKSVCFSAVALTLGHTLTANAYTHMSNPYAFQDGYCSASGSADINFQPGFAYSFYFYGVMYGPIFSAYGGGASGAVGGAPGTGPGNQVFYNGASRYANSWGAGYQFMVYSALAGVSWDGGEENGQSEASYMECSSS